MSTLVTAIPPRLRRRLDRWLEHWGTPSLTSTLRVEFSPRLRRAFGRCYLEQRLIRLAVSLGDTQSWLLNEILCHEAAHAAVYEMYGDTAAPHGKEWKELLRAAGFEPRVRIPVAVHTPVRDAARRVFYVHRCPVCERSRRATRPMQQWRCRDCLATRSAGRLVICRQSASRPTGREAVKSAQACRRQTASATAKAAAPKPKQRRKVAAI